MKQTMTNKTFTIGAIFYSKSLRDLHSVNQKLLPIMVLDVDVEKNELFVKYGSMQPQKDKWNLTHCNHAIERGDYFFENRTIPQLHEQFEEFEAPTKMPYGFDSIIRFHFERVNGRSYSSTHFGK